MSASQIPAANSPVRVIVGGAVLGIFSAIVFDQWHTRNKMFHQNFLEDVENHTAPMPAMRRRIPQREMNMIYTKSANHTEAVVEALTTYCEEMDIQVPEWLEE